MMYLPSAGNLVSRFGVLPVQTRKFAARITVSSPTCTSARKTVQRAQGTWTVFGDRNLAFPFHLSIVPLRCARFSFGRLKVLVAPYAPSVPAVLCTIGPVCTVQCIARYDPSVPGSAKHNRVCRYHAVHSTIRSASTRQCKAL
eukprot:2600971-Rhodomonas_salina.2